MHQSLIGLLVGCGTVNPSSNPIDISSPFVTVTEEATLTRPPTATRKPSATPSPRPTINLTATVIYQNALTAHSNALATRSMEETLASQFPHACETLWAPREFSPNGLWMAELCDINDSQDFMLTFSNSETQVLWKLFYKEYAPLVNNYPEGGMSVVHWSSDGRYTYFYSYLGGDGGECYVARTDSGSGLFRIDLQTGDTTAILPKNDNRIWYTFSFSSTGRRLLYGINSLGLKILDIPTGKLTNVTNADDFSQSGGYIWSPDGLQFVYSTVTTLDNWETRSYSLRLVDALSGNEQIILDSPDNCFVAALWSEDNILTVENYYHGDYFWTLMEYDLNLNKLIKEVTVTPFP